MEPAHHNTWSPTAGHNTRAIVAVTVITASDVMAFGVPLAFLWTAFVVELTPGPNMSYLAVLSLAEGRRAGLAAVAGVATGLLIVGLLSAFGLATIMAQSPILYHALRWVGCGYLLWLAYEIWHGTTAGAVTANGSQALASYFQRGLLTNLLNPKAAVFYVAILPPFVDVSRPVLGQTIAMTAAYVAIATVIHAAIVGLAARARPWITAGEDSATVRAALALSLVLIAIWLVWSTRLSANQP